MGKIVMKLPMLNATGSLQLCAGQDAGSEAAIHAVYDMLNEYDTEAVLMVDASNAFNSINREGFLHNANVFCLALATFIDNRYSIPSDLFLQGGKHLKSLEVAIQGDSAAVAIYALGIIRLLAWLSNLSKEKPEKFPSREVVFADDLNGAGLLKNFKNGAIYQNKKVENLIIT